MNRDLFERRGIRRRGFGKVLSGIVILAIIGVIVAGSTLDISGIAFLQNKKNQLVGNLIGNDFNIDSFDNYGNTTLTASGHKINIESNIVDEYVATSSGFETKPTLSSVITINIDGYQITSCGDTCVYYDKHLKPEYNFNLDEINTYSTDFKDNTVISGMINKAKNVFGKSTIIVIKTQDGLPLYAFSGDSVNFEVADDLPKFTYLSIDGYPLYIHRANYQIIDKELLEMAE